MQTKMEVGIWFWTPNLGLKDEEIKLLFRDEEL